MTKLRKGHNSETTGLVEKMKKTGPLIFHVYATIQCQDANISGSSVSHLQKRVTDERTDRQVQTNLPPQLLRGWGHKNKKGKKVIQVKVSHSLATVGAMRLETPFILGTAYERRSISLFC